MPTSGSTVAGHVHDVLSRIGPAGLDYSGRPNKYAHHVILEPEERPDGGPAWLLSQPGFLREAWEGEPRILAEGPPVPRGDRPPGIARGLADPDRRRRLGRRAGRVVPGRPRRPVFLVFRPGVELLPLFVEAIALLAAVAPLGRGVQHLPDDPASRRLLHLEGRPRRLAAGEGAPDACPTP